MLFAVSLSQNKSLPTTANNCSNPFVHAFTFFSRLSSFLSFQLTLLQDWFCNVPGRLHAANDFTGAAPRSALSNLLRCCAVPWRRWWWRCLGHLPAARSNRWCLWCSNWTWFSAMVGVVTFWANFGANSEFQSSLSLVGGCFWCCWRGSKLYYIWTTVVVAVQWKNW